MIYVKSFSGTEVVAFHPNTRKAIDKGTASATEEMQCWLEEFEGGFVKILSISTQLVVNEDIVSYIITVVVDQDGNTEA